jgi:hypothetical protein
MKEQKGRSAAKVDQGSRLTVIQSGVAGVDIGSREMFACAPAGSGEGREMQVFATTTQQTQECIGWVWT